MAISRGSSIPAESMSAHAGPGWQPQGNGQAHIASVRAASAVLPASTPTTTSWQDRHQYSPARRCTVRVPHDGQSGSVAATSMPGVYGDGAVAIWSENAHLPARQRDAEPAHAYPTAPPHNHRLTVRAGPRAGGLAMRARARLRLAQRSPHPAGAVVVALNEQRPVRTVASSPVAAIRFRCPQASGSVSR